MNKENSGTIVAIIIVILLATGMAFAGSQGEYKIAGVQVYALCIATTFIIKWIAFIPAYLNRTEKFYDITGGGGSLTSRFW